MILSATGSRVSRGLIRGALAKPGQRGLSARIAIRGAIGAGVAAIALSVHAADYYVSAADGSDGNSGSQTQPFRTLSRLSDVLGPGDTGHVASGSYDCLSINTSGTAARPIVVVGEGPSKPKLGASSARCGQNGVFIAASVGYVTINGFDVTAGTDGNAILIADRAHHITIAGNVAHDAACNGINSNKGDYVQIHDNAVYGNAATARNQCSGISLYQLTNVDANSGYHNKIYSNVVYHNYNGVPPTGSSHTTDGNGIIVDDSRHTQNGYAAPAYTGSTQIFNNIVFDNGGRGIDVFFSDNVMIVNNTVYLNNWDTRNSESRPGEIGVSHSGNVQAYNNIMQCLVSTANTPYHYGFAAQYSSGGSVLADYNLTYGSNTASYLMNSSIQFWGKNNRVGNPQFVVAATDPLMADFQVQSDSPALGLGSSVYAPATDIVGVARASGVPITAGAYESASPTSPSAPTATLTAPDSVVAGQSFTLSWTSTNASQCAASGGSSSDGWNGVLATEGSLTISEAVAGSQYQYGLTCTGSNGSAQVEKTVAITAAGSGNPSSAADSGSGGGAGSPVVLLTFAALRLLRIRRR